MDNIQIVLDEINKDFIEKFVAFSYEDICKDIFLNLCKSKQINFTVSRIGSYWLNDIDGDTEINVMAIDNTSKKVFIGECKYHNKPVDASVYFSLKEKIDKNNEIRKLYSSFEFIYGVFSKCGFTNRMIDIAKDNIEIILINEYNLVNYK